LLSVKDEKIISIISVNLVRLTRKIFLKREVKFQRQFEIKIKHGLRKTTKNDKF
jgi:hypothetical protein